MPDDPAPRPDKPGPLKRIGLAMTYALPVALLGGCNIGMVINEQWRCYDRTEAPPTCVPAISGVIFGLWLVLFVVTIVATIIVKNIQIGKLLMIGVFAAGAVSIPLVPLYIHTIPDGRDLLFSSGTEEAVVYAVIATAPMLVGCWVIGRRTLARMRMEERGATDQLGRN